MPTDPCPATTTDLGQPTRCILAAGHADEQHFDGAILWRDRAVARDVPPRLPHEWPADPRDPLVCIHGCGNTPADVFPEEECWRRLRAALEGAVGERDEARRMLAECYVLSGADTDGNTPETGAIHLYRYAVAEVRLLREEYDEVLISEGEAIKERDRLRVAARGVIAVWDGEYEDDRMAPKIDKLRDALAGRGEE